MKTVLVKIVGPKFIDSIGIIEYETFYADVFAGLNGEADIVGFHYVKDPQTNAYQEQHILTHLCRQMYNIGQSHGIYCNDCDTWKFGRSEAIFQSPCEDHDTITIAVTANYNRSEALDKLRKARDMFATQTDGESSFNIFLADDFFPIDTEEKLAVIELLYPESEEYVHQMVDVIRGLCPELGFAAREPVNCFIIVTNK